MVSYLSVNGTREGVVFAKRYAAETRESRIARSSERTRGGIDDPLGR